VIGSLIKNAVSRIFIVTGYKKEQFDFLTHKYDNITLIENKEFMRKNNISSFMTAADHIGENDTFICEADLFVSDPSVFSGIERSCYFGRFVHGMSDDWVFESENDRITGIRKGGSDLYNMAGASFWKKDDLSILIDAVRAAYEIPENGDLFWDEVVNDRIDVLDLAIRHVTGDQIIEIDTVRELEDFVLKR
jgi:CTP:phosphocholine cytidylyltransferase-like protein